MTIRRRWRITPLYAAGFARRNSPVWPAQRLNALLGAGPCSPTGPLMRVACLDAGCSYLDISGEIDDFSRALACDAQARAAGVVIFPGVGYGVVFAECLVCWHGACRTRRGCACRSRFFSRAGARWSLGRREARVRATELRLRQRGSATASRYAGRGATL
jgi:short subunit dehydrogenase-like uncharacterized protein